MLELVRSELVTPINPIEVLERPWEVTKPFLDLVEKNRNNVAMARNRFLQGRTGRMHQDKFLSAKIHADKFDESVFYGLEHLGLAERMEGRWYSVERRTADQLMKFLATVVGVKTGRLPTTDFIRPIYNKALSSGEQKKRETILANLIPFPLEIDIRRLRKFKEQHLDLLNVFKNKVELIVFDPAIKEGSKLFDENLIELLNRKHELAAKMNESQFSNIVFGTVCGLIGAFYGLATAASPGAIMGGIPGFAAAVHSALQIKKAENIFDQSGLKYLALVDKRLQR